MFIDAMQLVAGMNESCLHDRYVQGMFSFINPW